MVAPRVDSVSSPPSTPFQHHPLLASSARDGAFHGQVCTYAGTRAAY